MEIQLKVIGVLLIILALVHISFPRYFKWRDELAVLGLINRQMMLVHTFFIAFTVFLMGLLCVTSATEIIETTLGKRVALGMGVFWGVRLVFQQFVYSSKLWRGKPFETIIHIVFTILWIYLTYVFLAVYFR